MRLLQAIGACFSGLSEILLFFTAQVVAYNSGILLFFYCSGLPGFAADLTNIGVARGKNCVISEATGLGCCARMYRFDRWLLRRGTPHSPSSVAACDCRRALLGRNCVHNLSRMTCLGAHFQTIHACTSRRKQEH